MYRQWDSIRPLKRQQSYNSVDGFWGYYAKQNKPGRGRQLPCDLTYMGHLGRKWAHWYKLPEMEAGHGWHKGGQKVQTPNCKISPGDVMYSMGTTVNNTVWQEQVTKASSLEASDEGNWMVSAEQCRHAGGLFCSELTGQPSTSTFSFYHIQINRWIIHFKWVDCMVC